MINKLLITVAASALFTVPAFAQVSLAGEATQAAGAATEASGAAPTNVAAGVATTVAAEAPPATMSAEPADDAASMPSKAATGTASDTSGVVAMADLRTGTPVRDATGAQIGKIAKVKPGAAGASAMVTLDVGGQMAVVPATSLALSDGALVSSKTKAEILAGAR